MGGLQNENSSRNRTRGQWPNEFKRPPITDKDEEPKMCNKYNGWTNYGTWNVKLWLDNEPYTSQEMEEMAKRAIQDQRKQDYRTAGGLLADALKDWVNDEFIPDLGASMAADLLGSAIGSVNWYEIAENILEYMPKEEEDESEGEE